MAASAGIRVPGWGASLAILLAGSLLVGFSMGSWLAPPAAWIGPVPGMIGITFLMGWFASVAN